METKKQFLRILGIGLMLSVIVPIQAIDTKQSRWQLYRKCIANPRKCNPDEKAQIRADAKRVGKWAGPLLIAAAIAVGVTYGRRQQRAVPDYLRPEEIARRRGRHARTPAPGMRAHRRRPMYKPAPAPGMIAHRRRPMAKPTPAAPVVTPAVTIAGIQIKSMADVQIALHRIKKSLDEVGLAIDVKEGPEGQSEALDAEKKMQQFLLKHVNGLIDVAKRANEDQLSEFKGSLQQVESKLAELLAPPF